MVGSTFLTSMNALNIDRSDYSTIAGHVFTGDCSVVPLRLRMSCQLSTYIEGDFIPLAVGNWWSFGFYDGTTRKLGISGSSWVNFEGQDVLAYHWNWFVEDVPSEYYWLVINDEQGFWTQSFCPGFPQPSTSRKQENLHTRRT